jgi:hypothetical protein
MLKIFYNKDSHLLYAEFELRSRSWMEWVYVLSKYSHSGLHSLTRSLYCVLLRPTIQRRRLRSDDGFIDDIWGVSANSSNYPRRTTHPNDSIPSFSWMVLINKRQNGQWLCFLTTDMSLLRTHFALPSRLGAVKSVPAWVRGTKISLKSSWLQE